MKRKLTALFLSLALCVGLSVPALAAEEQKIVVNDGEVYAHVLRALLSCTDEESVTLRLESDVQLTMSSVILGISDYGGIFGGMVIEIIPHDITIDLNGYTLTGEEGVAVFEVQEGYTLTIVDTSEEKTGRLVTRGDETVAVAQGGTYNPLEEPEQPGESDDTEEHTGGSVSKPAINPNAGRNKEKVTFTDVAEDAWYDDAVSWAVTGGVTSGTGETTFSPNAPCTRGQAVTFLWRAMDEPAAAKAENPFTDVAESDYCHAAVLWAYEQGVTTGVSDTLFGVNEPCTRAQTVTFLSHV